MSGQSLADYIALAPKSKKPKQVVEAVKTPAKKPAIKKAMPVPVPIAPIIKVIEQPDYSPAVLKQSAATAKLAEQAIASMRDAINHNDAVMAEVINRLTVRPIRLDIKRDNKGDIMHIVPIYEAAR